MKYIVKKIYTSIMLEEPDADNFVQDLDKMFKSPQGRDAVFEHEFPTLYKLWQSLKKLDEVG